MQLAAARIGYGFGVSDFFIMGLTGISLTQIANTFRAAVGDDHILVTVGFLFAAVVQCLFFRFFWTLATAFRAVNNVLARVPLAFLVLDKLLRVSFRQNSQVAQCILENRQEAVNPIIGARLAQVEKFTEQGLHRIGFLIHERK
jgi:hypothetical protein